MHMPDVDTPMEETVRTLEDLVRVGKVRYVGGCNFWGWQVQKVVDMTKYMGFNQWVTLQVSSLTLSALFLELFNNFPRGTLGM